MENKQPTREDIAKETLENRVLQSVLGSNQILKNQALYGQLAINGTEDTYNETMNKEEVKEFRDALYKKKKEKGDMLGVYGEPSITNYDVSAEIIHQLEENKLRLPLKDLEKIVKNIAGNTFDFEVPKELSDYVPLELEEKMKIATLKALEKAEKISPEDMNAVLDEKEKDAFNVYKLLSQAYNRGVALSTGNYFADLNESGKKITEKYQPKESKE